MTGGRVLHLGSADAASRWARKRRTAGDRLDSYTFTGPGVGTGGARTGEIKGLGKCVDISSSQTADGTRVQVWTCNGHRRPAVDVARRRHRPRPGQVPRRQEQRDDERHAGPAVELQRPGAQQWAPQADGSLKNPQSGRCLDIPASNTDGARLQIHDCNGTGAPSAGPCPDCEAGRVGSYVMG
ncbi:ricin-type beta-trefoil lectin domain protein [Micromonospora coxensis]|uniref:ricin-type beta-trefoil lectin domain protein n=1 Tax=Micromonospora coxensis TaxID=356852 RepID=UPI00343B3854